MEKKKEAELTQKATCRSMHAWTATSTRGQLSPALWHPDVRLRVQLRDAGLRHPLCATEEPFTLPSLSRVSGTQTQLHSTNSKWKKITEMNNC
jgi:hypothetical protein